ncbi:putative sporulation protein YtxC [Fredinandcohnia sp. 179-A 10B2 NHS]|uniref:putative sporulation protein YtxC n=1 Tax=Fredinandcohnia sp. 179-A 10B2 NHS TaxID=3235176 RepID=UPI00399F4822
MHFQENTDAKKIYKSFLAKTGALSIDYIDVLQENENVVSITTTTEDVQNIVQGIVIPVITEFIIRYKEDQWLLTIIEELFYFTDIEEKKQILEITKMILDGNMPDLPSIQNVTPRKQVIAEALLDFMKVPISFSFESFLKFRLRTYNDSLIQFVETAIDEYKLEQEYQTFIQGLRDFQEKREPLFDQLHILHDEQFFFFNEEFTEIKREELLKYIDRRLILRQPMYIDSSVLAPLVSISPKSIYIYTDDMDSGMVQTILNIFFEKVTIYPKKYFESYRLQTKKI